MAATVSISSIIKRRAMGATTIGAIWINADKCESRSRAVKIPKEIFLSLKKIKKISSYFKNEEERIEKKRKNNNRRKKRRKRKR